MKQILITAILALTTLSFASCATSNEKATTSSSSPVTAASPGENVELTLTQMEQRWVEHILKHDTAATLADIERDIADEFVAIGWDGKSYAQFTKAQAIANVKSGAGTIESLTVEGMKVRVFGDTAVVTYSDHEKSKYQGRDTSGRYLITDVFAKRNARWQVVASHSSRIPQPNP